MTDEQASDWEYKIICCLGISTSNSDINVVSLHKTVTELYEQGRADEREAQVCCGDYEKCMKACTPRGRWLAEKELAKPEQEPVCDKDPFYCWSIRCQVGKVCNHAPSEPPFKLSDAGADTNIPLWGLEPKGEGMVALHQPEQEPVAWMLPDYGDVLSASEADGIGIYNIPLYTAPPRKEWVGLTNEEVQEIAKQLIDDAAYCSTHFAIAIEAELRRKNNAI